MTRFYGIILLKLLLYGDQVKIDGDCISLVMKYKARDYEAGKNYLDNIPNWCIESYKRLIVICIENMKEEYRNNYMFSTYGFKWIEYLLIAICSELNVDLDAQENSSNRQAK